MSLFTEENTGGLRLIISKSTWTPIPRSFLFGQYSFDADNFGIITKSGIENVICRCTRNCHSPLTAKVS